MPPAYALPPPNVGSTRKGEGTVGFDNQSYSAEVRQLLAEYEKKYGPRGTSDVTAEQVPIRAP